MFDNSLDGVMFTMPDGAILAANPAACGIFGMAEEELCRRGRQGLIDEDDPRWKAAVEQRRRTGHVRLTGRMKRADGSIFTAEVASTTFVQPGGEMRSCVVLRDVTDKVRAEQRIIAVSEITHALLAGRATTDVLTLIARHARNMIDATDAIVLTAEDPEGSVYVAAADGPSASAFVGRHYPPGSFGYSVMKAGQSRIVDDLRAVAEFEDGRRMGLGPTIVVPVASGEESFGTLMAGTSCKPGHRPYGADDLAVMEAFAEAAALALAMGRARAAKEQLAVLSEKERIAGHMHDSVIQQLFAVGLSLQAVIGRGKTPDSERIEESIRRLDGVIAEIRDTIYSIRRRQRKIDVADDVREIATDMEIPLGFAPHVVLKGVDRLDRPEIGSELILVAREALSNVARHARATKVDVTISVDDSVSLEVVDDGIGPPQGPTNGMGLRNMAQRANGLMGTFALEPVDPHGTRLRWRVPLSADSRDMAVSDTP